MTSREQPGVIGLLPDSSGRSIREASRVRLLPVTVLRGRVGLTSVFGAGILSVRVAAPCSFSEAAAAKIHVVCRRQVAACTLKQAGPLAIPRLRLLQIAPAVRT